jgi:hypothetical protein
MVDHWVGFDDATILYEITARTAISGGPAISGNHHFHAASNHRCPASKIAGNGPSSNTGTASYQLSHGDGIFRKPSFFSLATLRPTDPALKCPPVSWARAALY